MVDDSNSIAASDAVTELAYTCMSAIEPCAKSFCAPAGSGSQHRWSAACIPFEAVQELNNRLRLNMCAHPLRSYDDTVMRSSMD